MSVSMVCDRCPHPAHLGACEVDVVVQSVTTNCACFTAKGMLVSQRTLRQADAAQLRAIEELKRTGGRKPFILEEYAQRRPQVDACRFCITKPTDGSCCFGVKDEAAPDGLLPWERDE
jgi:hypothetical protein